MSGALDGIVVVDFSHVMAGPYASHLLKLLGAEVIKVEAPGIGDAMRNYGADRRYDGMAPAFIAVNAGKKSVGLILKHAPIPALEWPAMTMSFKVREKAQLQPLKKGDKVEFTLEKSGASYVITDIK